MEDRDFVWAFFDGCMKGILIVLVTLAYLILMITLIVYVSAWLFIPLFVGFCFWLVFLRYGKQWFIDQWEK